MWVLDAGALYRSDGDAWVTLPTPPDGGWTGASLAVGEGGRAVVAAVRRDPPRSYDSAGNSLVVGVLSESGWRQLEPEGPAEVPAPSARASAPGRRDLGPGRAQLTGQIARLLLETDVHVHHGEPTVAWSDGGELHVYRATEAGLVELPSPVDLPGVAVEPVLATGADGSLLLAWSHRPNVDGRLFPRQIQVRAWDGDRWRALGRTDPQGVSDTDADSVGPRLARSAAGSPVVAWTDELPGHPPEKRVYAATWNGEAWLPLRAEGPPRPKQAQPAVRVAVASAPGALAEAWSERPPHFPQRDATLRVRVRRGGGWVELPPIDTDGAVGVQLEVEPSGRLTVLSGQVWRGDPEAGWLGLGAPPRPRQASGHLTTHLAVGPDGTPWIARRTDAVELWRRSEAGWIDEGAAPGPSPSSFRFPSPFAFRLDALGRPVVAWSEDTIAGYRSVRAHVRGDDGWGPMGADPACGTVDAFAGDVRLVTGDAFPGNEGGDEGGWALAWVEERPPEGDPALELCRWDGTSWARLPPVGATSRRAWGSGTWAVSWLAGGPLVAWRESSPGRTQALRAAWWSGHEWVPLGRDGIVVHCDPTCSELVISAGELAWIERGPRAAQLTRMLPERTP